MKFTLVFPSDESHDLSIAALFVPCLVWVEGSEELLKPHPEKPEYLPGDLARVLDLPAVKKRLSPHTKKKNVVVVAHQNGHAPEQTLKDLVADLEGLGFNPIVCRT